MKVFKRLLDFDLYNITQIKKVVELYPLSFADCVKILKTIAPLTEVLDADGICKFLQDIVDIRCGDYAMNLLRVVYILKKYKIAEDEDNG